VKDGILSVKKAEEDYHVIVDPETLELNLEETEKLRGKNKKI
jgi:hypothetical protein